MKVLGVAFLLMFVMLSTSAGAEEEIFVYDDGGRRDPFWSLVNASGAIVNYGSDLMITDMILEGIIADVGGENLAIINGSVVKATDKIGLFTVESISQDEVVLVKGEENFTLKLKKEE